jgi:hypothetical protein
VAGSFHRTIGIWLAAAVSTGLGCAYVWSMRPIFAELPIDPRRDRWLVSLGLMPAARPAVAAAENA